MFCFFNWDSNILKQLCSGRFISLRDCGGKPFYWALYIFFMYKLQKMDIHGQQKTETDSKERKQTEIDKKDRSKQKGTETNWNKLKKYLGKVVKISQVKPSLVQTELDRNRQSASFLKCSIACLIALRKCLNEFICRQSIFVFFMTEIQIV